MIMKKATKMSLLFILLFGMITQQAAGQNDRMAYISTATMQGYHPVPEGSMELSALLSLIENEHEVSFLYEDPYLENKYVSSNILKSASLAEELGAALTQLGLTYSRQGDRTYVIKPAGTFELPLQADLFQQTVQGTVRDADTGEALPGVNIILKDSPSTGTVTDATGNFSLRVPSLNETLVFSYVGYLSQEVSLDGNDEIQVEMSQDVQMLDDLVVIGYGTQRKIEITSAVARVTEEDFNQGGSRSPLELIQGRVAGLSITRTGGSNPNAGTARQLRGVTSIHGDQSPLIVIDGIPGGNLDLLQPTDIESFDVLKDGSAAAIYGTRGNNGVILITTKKGRGGAPRYEYNMYMQHEMVAKKPDFLNASEFRNLISQGLIGAGNDLGHSTDLYDELINTNNLTQYHNFAASGGNENTNYRASFYFDDAEGIAHENSRQQFGGRLNLNQIGLNGLFLLQANLVTNINNANLLGGGNDDFEQAIQRNPTAPIRNPDGSFVETEAYNNYNPLSRHQFREHERDQQTFSGDVKATLNIVEGLGVSVFGAYSRNTWNDRYFRSMNDFDQRPESQYQGMGYASKDNRLWWDYTFETTVDYALDFDRDHSVDLIGGYSYQYFTEERFEMANNGFTTDGFKDWNMGAGSALNNTDLPRPSMGSFKQDNKLIAFFGRASYSYLDRYFAQFTLRREGSSKFGANNKWGSFPAVSLGWVLSDEGFMENQDIFSFLKFRVGYGITGNQGIPNYNSLVTLSTGGVYPQEGVFYQTYGAARNPNPDLKWERKQEWNFGLDFALLNDRISGELDIYNRETIDLLHNYTAQQPPFVRNSILTNVGSIQTKGVELYLNANILQDSDFSWSMDITANSQFNRMTSLSDDVYTLSWLEFGGLPSPGNLGAAIRLEEGSRIGNYYGKRFAGFTDEGQWLFYKADGSAVPPSQISDEDLTVIGNGVPKYMMSWANNFRYKNFDLTIFFRGKFGFDILNTQDLYFGNKNWLPNNLLRSAITKHAELNDNPQYSDYYLEKGDFVKLDNVTIGYNLNMTNNYIRNMRIYLSGRNLVTITGYSGLDPELQDTGFTTGIDSRGFYPRTRSFTVGLNIEF
ncbi:MAG TPA: SusC/RagA family TonB-linked outer membrane protein [Balneolaceae bacterium]|nr:SusC/RagA family TonB-linked outer membrane protein [Balneolaceae bacterium]